MTGKTLPQLLLNKAENNGNDIAMRQKYLGIWNEITWASYYSNVKDLAVGLVHSLDFRQGDKLAIIGENKPQWLYAELAAQSVGGIAVGVYQESTPSEFAFMLNHCEAKIVIVEDQELVDRLLSIEDQIPAIEKIIYYNSKGMRNYKHPKLMYIHDLQEHGKIYDDRNPDEFQKLIANGKSNDTAIIAYTSGTIGEPRGALLSHQNLISSANQMAKIETVKEGDDYLSFLPLVWIGEQVMNITMSLLHGATLNFPEETSTVGGDLREIGPHVIFAPPRMYENILSKFKLRIQGSSWFKKKVYDLFKPYGDKMAEAKLHNKPVSFSTKLMYTLGDYLIFSAIRDHLGLARVKSAYTNGGSIGTEVLEFFHGLGVNLKQTYGSAELSGVAFAHRNGDINLDSVGVPLPDTEVKISEEGEILIKSPGVFQGYYNNEVLTKNVLNGGWTHMGDAGYIGDDGHLYVVDRMQDVFQSKEGKKISPALIENKLKLSPYIREAVVIGKDRPYIVAMVNIDIDNVGRWAEKKQLNYTKYSDLTALPDVINLIEKEVSIIMKAVPENLQVRNFVLLDKELSTADQELTRLRKVRRNFVIKKYQYVIDELYGVESGISVNDTKITQIEQEVT
ncbi:AMP-binding protein [Paenisporosarcina antarctica]|uniref:Acyl-CoA synthetase n=1 Tax=Paenisporosarcina antarctica TaxID=417367 RepID=A0A4P6ZZQ7_9BACL|nr:AMP-binding protein [Paenisporosarcina antarctica]QBP41794.1 long-chain fatty acid--CoA ligase [Paenisporosarcina antarctica]